jgi:peroxiredoxin Q/BCP
MPREDPDPKSGDPAPDFALPDPTGTIHRLADYRGRKVALFFFRGTW